MDVTLHGVSASVAEHELVRLWYSELRTDEIADELKVGIDFVWLAARRMRLPKRPTHLRAIRKAAVNADPSEDDIRAACAVIQAKWSAEEEKRRRVGWGERAPYSIPTFRTHRSKVGRLADVTHHAHDC